MKRMFRKKCSTCQIKGEKGYTNHINQARISRDCTDFRSFIRVFREIRA